LTPAWKDGLQAVTYLVAIFATALSWLQYKKNSARERTRWLFDLYERFYGRPDVIRYVREYDYGELDRLLRELGYAS